MRDYHVHLPDDASAALERRAAEEHRTATNYMRLLILRGLAADVRAQEKEARRKALT